MSASTGEPGLTDEQKRPLRVAGASVALSAGAGCGKTTVLTERFLTALDGDGTATGRSPLRALVALTFTEKAARELRKRIREVCHRRLGDATGDEVGYWRAVLRGLEAAPVGTFHEYCAGLLRRHALHAGIDPDFQVFDASLADTVRDEALTRCVRGWLAARNPDLIELAVEYGLRSVRESLGTLVGARSAADLAEWETRSEDEVVAAWQRFWEKDGRPALVRSFLDGARACRSVLAENECRHPVMSQRRLALLDGFQALESTSEPGGVLAEILENAKVQGGGKAEHWPAQEVYEEVKARLTKLRDSVRKLLERINVDESVTRQCAGHGLRFARLAMEARKAYDETKRVRGGLDFDDLLVKARAWLRASPISDVPPLGGGIEGGSEPARTAGNRTPPTHPFARGGVLLDALARDPDAESDTPALGVEFVLVDEFQDTDPVQSDILKSLGGDQYALGRLFVVGDFKQSIYRFRGARPKLFQEVRDEFPAEGRHELTENFRSSVGVIDFVNALFAEAFTGERPHLKPGPNSAPAGDGPAVEFVWAGGVEREEEEQEGQEKEKRKRPGVDEMRKTEAQWLARLIKGRLKTGWPVRDRATKQVRNARENDVAFLFRAMTDLAPYEAALKAEGLDFHVVGGKAFYAQQEVLDLVNVLSVIEDPLDAVALAGALRGPFFGLSDGALFRLCRAGEDDLAGCLGPSRSLAGLSPLDRHRTERARELLDRWRGLKDRVPIAELVDRVLDESGFEAALLGEFLGDRKRANARKLVRLARRFDARGGFTLGHFVGRLRNDLREPPREEQASTTEEEGDSIRLMSIHQSKGLEFPIVVVPDLNRKQELPRKPVAFHPDLGPLVRPGTSVPADGPEAAADDDEGGSGRSLGWVAYEAVERMEEEAESRRLFYVAATRARDALILSAGVGPDANPVSAALKLLGERFDRRTGACRAALPDGWAAPAVRVTTECPPPSGIRPRRAPRPRLRMIARVIETAPMREPSIGLSAPARPRFVDLDESRGLSPRSERLDRLVRSILADPRALAPGMLADVARVAARRQEPSAHKDLVDEAVGLLERWISGPIGLEIRRAKTVERGKEWTVLHGQTVFHGRAEFLSRDANGVCRAVIFSAPGAAGPVERLRLLLCVRAADDLAFGTIVQGWRVQLGDGLHGEDDFRPEVVEAAVGDALEALSRSNREHHGFS